MSRWPQSLLGRNVLLMVGLILFSQAVAFVMLAAFFFLPQSNRVAGIVADAIASMSATMDALPPDRRADLLSELNKSPYIEIVPGESPPPLADRGRPAMLERLFMQQLVDRLKGQSELVWRIGHGRVVWVKLRIGPEPYWVAARAPNMLDPLTASLVAILGASGLAMLAGLWLSRQLAQPLRDLQAAADEVSLGSGQSALEARGPREIQALAGSFNRMTQRLADAETDRAMVLAGISHDLRTPLAKLRLAVEMMPIDSDLHATATAQVERMDRLLRQFLDYARGFEGEEVQVVDLANLARAAAADCAPLGGVAVRAAGPVASRVRPEAMRRALTNLVENAIAHGRPPVEVEVRSTGEGAEVVVVDAGPGAPEEAIEAMKEPFRRGPNSGRVAGSGLGLAIVDRIARMHGGEFILRNRDEGGLEAKLVLPGPERALRVPQGGSLG